MCEWGDTVEIELMISASLGHTGNTYKKLVSIDRCIAPIVKALNDVGMTTVASCCGHGKQPGTIALVNGREIMIFANYEDARRVNKLFLPINT